MNAFDILTVYTNDHADVVPVPVNYILNGVYFFVGALTALFFLYYTVSVAFKNVDKRRKRIFASATGGIVLLYAISLFVNGFTGIYFNFDNNTYNHGPIYLLVNIVAFLLIFESLIIYIIRYRNFNKKQLVCAALFFSSFFVSLALQVFVFPKVLLSDFGTVLGALIVFFSIETPDYVKLMQTLYELNELKASLEIQVNNRTRELDKEKHSYEVLTLETLSSLAELIDAKDHYTNGHSFRVAAYAKGLAKKLDFSNREAEQVYFAGLVHDVGKIGISEAILTKPGKLSDEEYRIIQSHSSLGGNILKSIKEFKIFEDVARCHHERYDGNGYPDKLKGANIPYEARLVAVCDTFDAMTSDRSYRKALSDEAAIEELIRVKNTQLDGDLVDAFVEICNSYPDSIRNHIEELKA